jgi:hypothetical protein
MNQTNLSKNLCKNFSNGQWVSLRGYLVNLETPQKLNNANNNRVIY